MTVCMWCKQPLKWTSDGWRHPGGALYMQRCGKCGFKTDFDTRSSHCPQCEDGKFVDDHCALPLGHAEEKQ